MKLVKTIKIGNYTMVTSNNLLDIPNAGTFATTKYQTKFTFKGQDVYTREHNYLITAIFLYRQLRKFVDAGLKNKSKLSIWLSNI